MSHRMYGIISNPDEDRDWPNDIHCNDDMMFCNINNMSNKDNKNNNPDIKPSIEINIVSPLSKRQGSNDIKHIIIPRTTSL